MRKFILATVLALGCTSIVAAPVFAGEGGDKKAEMKCDKAGKACKDGADCKAENCKGEKK
jgi:hypothetical protein